MSNSTQGWVKEGFDALAQRTILRVNSSLKPVITILVADVWISEVVYRRAEYDGRVVLDVTVSVDGKNCYEGPVDGFAENYGYAGKAENYQETINHALDRALLKAFGDPAFSEALCKCGAE